ncbi:MAG: hypothetical protein HY758_05320 [Nitrospirae bacterium]|nr:hypothetical protein [Nitrospirota bacterium]
MIKIIFYFAIFALIIYSAILTVIPLYHYYAFKNDLEEILAVSITDKPEDVLEKIYDSALELNVQVEKEDIELWKERRYFAAVSWEETVDFFSLYQKTFIFSIDTSKQSSWKIVNNNLQSEFS